MRIRMAGLLAGIAVAGALIGGSAPATAAPATSGAHTMSSTHQVDVHFYNNGWYWAYADIWGRDANGTVIYHDWSGSVGHTGNRWFHVPAGVASLETLVRLEPFGNTIHHQYINPWFDFDCSDGKHPTMYVGGVAGSGDHYDMHCSNW